MICAEHLCKTYQVKRRKNFMTGSKESVEAVQDVSLQIEKGAIVGVLGVNGAGKTTTIKMLTTLLAPTAGSYFFDGIDAVRNPAVVKRQINMIAGGERMIYWRLSAYENLWYYGQLYGVANNVLRQRIPELLALVGLTDKQDLPVETYSKGMKQRLQIARGLINDPAYLFMDEPTIGLDAVVTKELHQHILALAKERGKGILLTSHYLAEVETLCDYIYILSHGRVVLQGSVAELSGAVFADKQYAYTLQEMKDPAACPALQRALQQALAETDATVSLSEAGDSFVIRSGAALSGLLTSFAVKNGYTIESLYEKKPSLEDVMLKLSWQERGGAGD